MHNHCGAFFIARRVAPALELVDDVRLSIERIDMYVILLIALECGISRSDHASGSWHAASLAR